ncbi:MAG TPA: D-2-hydroxyacid dehydrogenase [Armatimonadota bacterium]|nr:D-2-hydroxyacid dehydrogenase [Armatimonadota bacterium]
MVDEAITILLPHNTSEEVIAQVRALALLVRIVDADALSKHPELVEEVDICFGYIRPELLMRARRLRWIQTLGAGVEWLLTPEIKVSPVIITNVHIHGESIAEHLFGMLLMLTRRLHEAYRLQMEERWGPIEGIDLLAGKTLGIIGTGVIGSRTAEVGTAFGMRVLGMRRSGKEQPPYAIMYTPDQKAEMLPQCDVLILAMPLTAETVHFIGAEELALLPPGALILNIGRGKLIDTDALVDALRTGHLGGAGLDVVDPEPLPVGHPLWKMPNVIITPHNAGMYPGYYADAIQIFLKNLRRYLAGEPLINVVDKERGY